MLADKINSGGHKWGRRAPAADLSGAGMRYLINSGGIITATPHSSNFESIGDQIVQNVQEQVVRGVGLIPGSFREFCAEQDGGMSPPASCSGSDMLCQGKKIGKMAGNLPQCQLCQRNAMTRIKSPPSSLFFLESLSDPSEPGSQLGAVCHEAALKILCCEPGGWSWSWE